MQYSITPEMVAKAVESNCAIQSLAYALRTDLISGIIGDPTDLKFRREAFGSNINTSRLLQRPPSHTIKSIKRLLSDALRDTTILLLLCCAMLSLAIGVKTNGAVEVVIDAALFLLAMSSVVCFGAAARFLRERWMLRKSTVKRNDDVCVVRNGVVGVILESELVVGDIVWLNTGDRVPADGILINGDDSFQLNADLGKDYSQCPSLFTGGEVVQGHCPMLVTAVGDNTERSRLIRSIGKPQSDRLQLLASIEKTSSKLDRIWLSLSLILLVVQLVRCFVVKKVRDRCLDPKGVKNRMEDLMKEVMKKERSKAHGLVTMLCMLLFASREGLPLALFVSLMYSSNRIKSCKAIVRQLQASAAVGLITTVCTCKTADLALQHSTLADLWIGFDLVHHHSLGQVETQIVEALCEGILLHSSPNGSVEEISLLSWARTVLGLNMESYSSMVRYEMDANLWCSTVKRGSEVADKVVVHVHWRGSPESILSMCSHYYTVDGKIETLDAAKTTAFSQIAVGCDQCCFAFAHKREIREEEDNDDTKSLRSDLILLGLVCLKNPYSAEVIEAIEDCRKIGVEVKLVVDDDIATARIIAIYSGLVRRGDEGGAIVDAGDFQSRSEADRLSTVENILVMANASPADKMLMVRCLRQKRRVVAAAVAATRDSPLLKQADIGFFMGPRSTSDEEDADIVVPGGNFSQIPRIVNFGRRVSRSLEKIVQLQLTMEISAFIINVVSLSATSKEALSSFQVLWINLIMEILGAAAVAITTVDASSSRADADPVYGSGRVMTRPMCTSIAVQSTFQVAVVLVMLLKGESVFQVNESAVGSMIFNCYAFCQVFLLIPAIEMKKGDVAAGRSCLFLGIVVIIGILQVAVVEITGVVARRPRLDVKLWCICIGISSLSLPLKCAANWMIGNCIYYVKKYGRLLNN